jgi:EPS-associated MarR family transcriptional regulator
MTAATKNKLPDSSTELQAKSQTELIEGLEVHLRLLKLLEQNPGWTQRQLADALGISLGKTNYCLRALRDKGLIKWGNFSQNPNKLQYMHLLTPQGIAQKVRLTAHFLYRKEREYEELRHEIARLRAELDEGSSFTSATRSPPSLTELDSQGQAA